MVMNRKTDNSEIEITPEMVKAGRDAIERRWI
jgi:hypothetical protein